MPHPPPARDSRVEPENDGDRNGENGLHVRPHRSASVPTFHHAACQRLNAERRVTSLACSSMPSVDAEISAKVELVMRADKAARAYDPRIKEVRASYADELRNILVVASDGTFAEDSQPLARINVSCIAKTEGNSARGTSGGGGRVALDFFFSDKNPEFFAKESARQALLQLDAREAPAGEMEVVLGPADVDPGVRAKVGEMQRNALELQAPYWETLDEDMLVPEIAERLGEVEAPTLVLVGEEDVDDMQRLAELFARAIPEARLASIPGAAHIPSLEQPAAFDELVLGFLAETL